MEKNNIFLIICAIVLVVTVGAIIGLISFVNTGEDYSTYVELPTEEEIQEESLQEQILRERQERLNDIQEIISSHERNMIGLIDTFERDIVEIEEERQREESGDDFNLDDRQGSQILSLADLISSGNCESLIDNAKDVVKDAKKDENNAEDDIRDQDINLQRAQDALNDAIAANASIVEIDRLTRDLEDEEDERDDLRQEERDLRRIRELAEDKLDEIQDRCREELRTELFAQVNLINDAETCQEAVEIAQDARDEADEDVEEAEDDLNDQRDDVREAERRLQDARDMLDDAIRMNATQAEIESRQRFVNIKEDDLEDAQDDEEEAEDRLDEEEQQLEDYADLITELRSRCRRFV